MVDDNLFPNVRRRRQFERHPIADQIGMNYGELYVRDDESVMLMVLTLLQNRRPSNNREENARWLRGNAHFIAQMAVQEILLLDDHDPIRIRIIYGGVMFNFVKLCIFDRVRGHLDSERIEDDVLPPSFNEAITEILLRYQIVPIEYWEMNRIQNALQASFNPQENDYNLDENLRHILAHYVTLLAFRCAQGNDNLPQLPEELHHLRWEDDN